MNFNATIPNGFQPPTRVFPGKLSVSRTFGDIEAKSPKHGGNPEVVICQPDIQKFTINENTQDFLILGCDGIYDQLENNEIINGIWSIMKKNPTDNNSNMVNNIIKEENTDIGSDSSGSSSKTVHDKSSLAVDLIMKSALSRTCYDNITVCFINFGNLICSPTNNTEINSTNNNANNVKVVNKKSSKIINNLALTRKKTESIKILDGNDLFTNINNNTDSQNKKIPKTYKMQHIKTLSNSVNSNGGGSGVENTNNLFRKSSTNTNAINNHNNNNNHNATELKLNINPMFSSSK